jgi:hypothetical protein
MLIQTPVDVMEMPPDIPQVLRGTAAVGASPVCVRSSGIVLIAISPHGLETKELLWTC